MINDIPLNPEKAEGVRKFDIRVGGVENRGRSLIQTVVGEEGRERA
jgi:hypothetical protein